jgi:exportin-2 (importin alpha re-exporter)
MIAFIIAEVRLMEAQKNSSCHLEILKIVASSDGVDNAMRQAAAVHFKNTIKKGWVVNVDDENNNNNHGIVITEADRMTIKSNLVQLMCTVPPIIQSLLSESISLIAANDYPDLWKNLLPELVHQFNAPDLMTVIGVLKTANSIFMKFRYGFRSDALYSVINYTLDIIQEPMLSLFRTVGQAVQSFANDAKELIPRFEILQLICEIYYSLNFQDLPAFFEDHMNEWMTDFASYLQYQNALLVDTSEEQNSGPIDKLQVSIINIISLYASKDEEEFIEYLPQFTTLVWNLLTNLTKYTKHDELATKSIMFLSNLIEKPMHKNLFQDNATLRQIIAKVVVPNLTFRDVDEERFEDDPREYILTEVEGSDSETRRRSSEVLLRAMCRLFEVETVAVCYEHIGTMLEEYAANPATAWVAKDAAVSRIHYYLLFYSFVTVSTVLFNSNTKMITLHWTTDSFNDGDRH